MLYPRLLFLLPYLVLLVAAAAKSAPVPDPKGCTSCPNLPRALGRFFSSKGKQVVDDSPESWTKGWLVFAKEQAEGGLQRARNELQRIKNSSPESDPEQQQLQTTHWETQIRQFQEEIDSLQAQLDAL